ncbi:MULTISPECIES: hypothetical protein [Rahnella]|uniref:hypothetical protein n=1 Tax=Rahnella TaxID=34037 RepID=UPI0006FF5B53|nr:MULTISPECIES: hypothetical protein [Rahnella]KQN52820.1 hypothetical protein ASE99_11965 [Serratia sp. Leaf51]MBB6116506.1 hypothetical protein [Rahnella inusitata]MBU9829487.1 hypothetical protein [Rahnella rivi]THD42968.1 hypothetical protein ERD95_21595 [Enterobacteriaceae bacterium ML5]
MKVLKNETDYITWMFDNYFQLSKATVSPLMSDGEIKEVLTELHPESFPCIGYLTFSSTGCNCEVNYISRDMVSEWAVELDIH